MNDETIRRELATCVRMLEYLGLIDFSGHVSCRGPEGDTMYVNPWGGTVAPHRVRPEDIVKADLEGKPLTAGAKLPSEKDIHAAIYRRRPDVNAVAHLHPPITTALGIAGKKYEPVMHHGAVFHAGVSVHDDCGHVNTRAKGEAVADSLGVLRATIMRGHGAVVVAETVKGVFFGSVYLEDNAKKLVDAYKMGAAPQVLRPDELEAASKVWRQDQFEKVWDYYEDKAGLRFG